MSPVVPRFDLSEEPAACGAHVVVVRGEIHLSTAPGLSQRLSDAIDAGATRLILDLTAVEFIDSTGLSVLLAGLRRVHQLQGRMALVCVSPTVLRLFHITGLEETFDIFADRAAADAFVCQAAGGSSEGEP